MSVALLDQTLRQVPFLATLALRVEEARPGHVVLRLPYARAVCNHGGALHSAAIFAVGEVAAAVAVGTHPTLAKVQHLQKSTKIKYYLATAKDVTAHVTLTDEMIRRVQEGVAGGACDLEVPVKVLDGHGNDVAELASKFTFRRR